MAEIDNLKIAEQLNKALGDRKAMLAAQTREMQSQLQLAMQLKAVIDGMDAEEMTKRLGEAQKALEAMGQSAQNINQTAGQAMSSIAKGATKAGDATGKLEKHTKLLLAKYPALKSVGTAALSGLSQGFANILSIGKGVVGVTESIVSGMWELGKSILAIPLKIFQGLLDTAANFVGDPALARAFEELRKQFGSFKEDVAKNVITSFHEIQKGLTGTGLSAFRVLGPLADQLIYFTKQAENAGAQIHTYGDEMAKTAGSFTAFEKGLAVGENLKGMMDRATEAGTSLGEQFRLTANYSLQMGKDFGISQKVLAKDIGSMMKDVKNFGSLTQKEMSVAAVYTRKLGIEVKNLLGLIDKFDTFEDAATAAAQLNQAFGASVDAFKLMQEQDPAKRIDMLRKSMAAAGKSTENMSRQELKLLAQTTGLDEATSKLAFSSKNQGISYDEVQKKAEKSEKAQLSQTQVLSKLADSIERIIQTAQPLQGSFFKMFMQGFSLGVKWSQPFLDLMINLRQALMQTMWAGRDVGKAFIKYFPGMTDSLENLAKMFAPGRFGKLLDGVKKSFIDFFKDMAGGQYSLKNLLENLQKNFLNWFDSNSQEGKGLLEGAKKILKVFASIVGQGIKYVVEKLTQGMSALADFIKDPAAFLAKLKGGAASSGAMGILQPLLDSLSDPKLWQNLIGAAKKLFSVVFSKLKDFFTGPEFMGVVKDYWPIVATVLFGPALTRVLAATLLQTIGKVFLSSGKHIGKVMQGGVEGISKAAQQAGQAGQAGKGSELTEKNLPTPGAQKGLGGLIKSLKDLKTGDIIQAGLKGVLLSVFIGGALVALISSIALSAKVIDSLNVSTKSFALALGSMVTIVLSMIPMMVALRVAAKMPLGEIMNGLAATGIVVGAMAASLALITMAFSALKLSNVEEVAKSMALMGVVFMAASAVVVVAALAGTIVTAGAGVGGLLALAGLAAIVVVVESMALSMISIMKQINSVEISPGFVEKVHAFTEIMKAVGSLTGNIASLIAAASPSWIEILSGKGSTLDNMKQLQSFVDEFVTHIKTLVDTLLDSIAKMASKPEMLKGAEAFGQIMSGVAAMAQALIPPPEMKSGFDSIMNVVRGESSDTQLNDTQNYVKRFTNQITEFIGNLKGTIKDLSNLGITDQGLKGIEAFAKVSTAVIGIIKAITPSPEMLKSMQSSVSQSTVNVGISKFNSQGLVDMGDYFKKVLSAIGPLLKTLTGDAIKGVITASESIDVTKMDKINKVLQIITTITNFMGVVSEISKHASSKQTTDDKGVLTTITTVFPSFSNILTGIQDTVPKLVDSIMSLQIPTGKDVSGRLDTLKKTFETLGGMGTVFKGFTGDSGSINAEQLAQNVERLGNAINMIFFMKGANATGTSPIKEVINHMNYIGDHMSEFQLTPKARQAIDSIKGIGEAAGSVASALSAVSSSASALQGVNLGKILPEESDLDEKFGLKKVGPYLSGLANFASKLRALGGDIGDKTITPSLKAVQGVVASVNELNTLLSGDANKINLSTNLKKFVDGSGLGSKGSFTIQNKGIQMTVNMEVKMNAGELEEALIFRKSSVIREAIKDSTGITDENDKSKLRGF